MVKLTRGQLGGTSLNGGILTLPQFHLKCNTLFNERGRNLQALWPLLAFKLSQCGHRELFRAWSNEGRNWPNAEPIGPAANPREMK